MAAFKISDLVLVIFTLHLYFSSVTASREGLLKELSLVERHEKWMVSHGRVYHDEIEKEHGFRTFNKNVEFIESFNQLNGTGRYKLAINKYADLTTEEFTASFMGLDTSLSSHDNQQASPATTTTTSSFIYDSVTQVPVSMDWRKSGTVTAIKDQGRCECCWAFSAVAAIEGAYQLANKELISLSEQQLLDCSMQNNGCKGGLMTLAYDYLLENNSGGITRETNYPYQESQSVCRQSSSSAAVTIRGYQVVPVSEASLLQAVANQPISVGIAASQEFHMYGSGIYDGSCYPRLNHAVTVIGYGRSEDGVNYWLVKNSWGTSWGEQGYMRIARDVEVHGGHCGIAKMASFPTL